MRSNILMVYPESPVSYWSMHYYLQFIGKKAATAPLGLITIAALTPPRYAIRLVDMSVQPLTDADILWADLVCFSAMLIQKEALFAAAARCRLLGKTVVFGGPYPTSSSEECAAHCDVLVLDEGEITWPDFLRDWERGCHEKVYRASEKPDVTRTPVPRFDLLRVQDYLYMPVQFSRGCPFQCEFCDIIVLFGRKPRTKTPEQMLAELDALYATGFRGFVFLVDDNFIGNKKEVKKLLPRLAEWNKAKGHPFYFGTEASINLAEEPELMRLMVEALFFWVFVGIESPSLESLKETKKFQNIGAPLLSRVRAIQQAGIIVWGGFIIGFDSDDETIFERQRRFIEEAGIPNASVGLLYALTGTPLYERLKKEGRLYLPSDTGDAPGLVDNHIHSGLTNIRMNIPRDILSARYHDLMRDLYVPHNFFSRVVTCLMNQPRPQSLWKRLQQVLWQSRLLQRNFLMKDPVTGKAPSLWVKWRRLFRAYRCLPPEFKRSVPGFIGEVLIKCPHQAAWIGPYILFGLHFYRLVFENMPSNHESPAPEQEIALAGRDL